LIDITCSSRTAAIEDGLKEEGIDLKDFKIIFNGAAKGTSTTVNVLCLNSSQPQEYVERVFQRIVELNNIYNAGQFVNNGGLIRETLKTDIDDFKKDTI
jgi:hypothetical protein